MAGRVLHKNVELFHAGSFREGTEDAATYSAEDLRDMVVNFALLRHGDRPALVPPVGKGHDSGEAEELFASDDGPRCGEVVRLWTEQGEIDGQSVLFLKADLGLDEETKAEVDGGAFPSVSAEVYDEPPEGAPAGASGRTLKRVALLGFELPQLKRLKRGAAAARAGKRAWLYSERRARTHGEGGGSMEPEQKKAAVKSAFPDLPQELLDSLTDDQIELLVGAALAKAAGASPDANATTEMADAATMSREELVAALTDLGQDPAQLEGMTDDELRALYEKLTASPEAAAMSETATPATLIPATPAAAFSERAVLARIQSAERGALARIKAAEQRAKRTATAEMKSKKARAFCEEGLRPGGFIIPAEMDRGPKGDNYTIYDELMDADDTVVVRKFSEGGKVVTKTKMDLLMDRFRSRGRTSRLFSEQIPQSSGQAGGRVAELVKMAQDMAAARKPARTIHEKLGLLPPAGLR